MKKALKIGGILIWIVFTLGLMLYSFVLSIQADKERELRKACEEQFENYRKGEAINSQSQQ